jgi:tetratricopeptide (TPR) repeat protein
LLRAGALVVDNPGLPVLLPYGGWMKRSLWLTLIIIALASAGVGLLAVGQDDEWSTTSSAALLEMEAAQQDRMKLYNADAAAHFEQALVHDPDLVAAKVFLIESSMVPGERMKVLLNELREADLGKLNPRERFMVKRLMARVDKNTDEESRLVDEYLDKYPKDVYALDVKVHLVLMNQDAEEAEQLYERMIEINPNWVWAYNQLGYLVMGQGRFSEAEEHFIFYRYIAPDQANPHDSLGELYLVLGRYDEAIVSFEKALGIKPDFPSPYQQMLRIHLLRGDFEAAETALQRAESIEALSARAGMMRCSYELAQLINGGAWQQILEASPVSCGESFSPGSEKSFATHLAACRLGRFEKAQGFEEQIRRIIGKVDKPDVVARFQAYLLYMEAVRSIYQGDLDGARGKLLESDERVTYYEATQALFKLTVRLTLVEVLLSLGEEEIAQAWLEQVRDVNPQRARAFEEHGMSIIGAVH